MNEKARAINRQSSYMHAVEMGGRGSLKYSDSDKLSKYLGLSVEEREKMFDLEGLVRDSVPSDIQEILKNNLVWGEIIRRTSAGFVNKHSFQHNWV